MPEAVAIARQGLAIGGPAEVGFDKLTLPYVPGSTLRGALASVWIQQNGVPGRDNPRREEFISLFERDVRYGPLFQDGSAVVPLSALWCKYPATAACRSWSADAATEDDTAVCPHCGGATEVGKGEVTGVQAQRILRTRLDDDGRAMDGHLYARQELAAGLTYRGHLAGTHPWLQEPKEIWLGGRTSTRGLATFGLTPEPELPGKLAVPASPRSDGALVIRLTSPAIIVDDAGRPSLDPVPEILRVLGLPENSQEVARCWTRPVRVGGWHAASGLPKPTELALSLGSVVVLHLREQPDQEALRRLACEGIGLRRIEGFGSVQLNPQPWRRTPEPPAEAAAAEPSLLAGLREHGLLQDETVVRWLLDRCRLVLVERHRDPGFSVTALFEERVAVYFSDAQAAAVAAVFCSARLPAAIPLIEQELERITAGQPAATPGDSQ
jgi:CRISPR-associated protein Csx10